MMLENRINSVTYARAVAVALSGLALSLPCRVLAQEAKPLDGSTTGFTAISDLSLQKMAEGSLGPIFNSVTVKQGIKSQTESCPAIMELQVILRSLFGEDLQPDGKPGIETFEAASRARKLLRLESDPQVVLDRELAVVLFNLRDRPEAIVEGWTLKKGTAFKYLGYTSRLSTDPIILEAQQLLSEQGFNCGKADSKLGLATTAQLIRYQKSRDISDELGVLGSETLQSLRSRAPSSVKLAVERILREDPALFETPENRQKIIEFLRQDNVQVLSTLNAFISTSLFRHGDATDRENLLKIAILAPDESRPVLAYWCRVLEGAATVEQAKFLKSDTSGNSLLHNITELLHQKYNPQVEKNRSKFLTETISLAIQIDGLNHQNGFTCGPTAILRSEPPATILRIAVDLFSTGRHKLWKNQELVFEPNSLQTEALRGVYKNLSYLEAAFCTAAMNYARSDENLYYNPVTGGFYDRVTKQPAQAKGVATLGIVDLISAIEGSQFAAIVPKSPFQSIGELRATIKDRAILGFAWGAKMNHAVVYKQELPLFLRRADVKAVFPDAIFIGNSQETGSLPIGTAIQSSGEGPKRFYVSESIEGINFEDFQEKLVYIVQPVD